MRGRRVAGDPQIGPGGAQGTDGDQGRAQVEREFGADPAGGRGEHAGHRRTVGRGHEHARAVASEGVANETPLSALRTAAITAAPAKFTAR